MRYDFNDHEWVVIEPMLPSKPRGVPRLPAFIKPGQSAFGYAPMSSRPRAL